MAVSAKKQGSAMFQIRYEAAEAGDLEATTHIDAYLDGDDAALFRLDAVKRAESHIVRLLRLVHADAVSWNLGIDVRLQVTDHLAMQLYTGDSSFDQDHSGHWSAGTVFPDMSDTDLSDLARGLILEAIEDMTFDENGDRA